MGLMTQHTEHTSNKHMRKLNLSEYRRLQMEKAEKPDYLQNPAEGTRSHLRYQAKRRSPRGTTSETEVSLQKNKLSKHEYKGTQQVLQQNLLYMLILKMVVGLLQQDSFDSWLSYPTRHH